MSAEQQPEMKAGSQVESEARPTSPSRPRQRRQAPARTEPIRSAIGFRGSERASASTASQRVINSAVENAYRVYEEYMQWGSQFAAQREPKRAGGAMDNRKPDMASMTQDAMRMWQDVAQMWMSMMTAYWQWPPMAAGRMEPKPKEGSTLSASSGVSSVVVSSQAAMPVQVAVHLSLVEPGTRLSVRPEQVGGAGAIDTVALSWVTDTLTVELEVPPGLAEGRYWGSIVDDYGRERGTLRVKLGA